MSFMGTMSVGFNVKKIDVFYENQWLSLESVKNILACLPCSFHTDSMDVIFNNFDFLVEKIEYSTCYPHLISSPNELTH